MRLDKMKGKMPANLSKGSLPLEVYSHYYLLKASKLEFLVKGQACGGSASTIPRSRYIPRSCRLSSRQKAPPSDGAGTLVLREDETATADWQGQIIDAQETPLKGYAIISGPAILHTYGNCSFKFT